MEQYVEVDATGMGRRRVVGEWLVGVVPAPKIWDLRRCDNWQSMFV